jgi:hypothetical protein
VNYSMLLAAAITMLLCSIVFADEYNNVSGIKVFDLTPSVVGNNDMIVKFNTNKLAVCNCTELDGRELLGNESAMQIGGYYHLKSFETRNLAEGNHSIKISCSNPMDTTNAIDFRVNVTLKKKSFS